MTSANSNMSSSQTKVRGTEPAIAVRDLTVHYNRLCALSNINLSIFPNRVCALVGPSGCGKSTFLNCLNRMTDWINDCRVSGAILFHGQDLLDPEIDVIGLRRRIGMIFQKPNPFPMSIRRNIEMPLREHGIRDRVQLQHITESSLKAVGLWNEVQDRLESPALTLSGGQQQRLCIARAIALEPEVLLMDEPGSALDPISSAVVEDLILSLRERYTLVVVTHDLNQAKRIADDLAIFWYRENTGRLIESGPASQVFQSPIDPDAQKYLAGLRAT